MALRHRRLRISAAAHHRQFVARGFAERGRALRPADRRRHPGGGSQNRPARAQATRVLRRTVLGRRSCAKRRKLLPVADRRRESSGSEMILPAANALEASLLRGAKLRLLSHLDEVVAALRRQAAECRAQCHRVTSGCAPKIQLGRSDRSRKPIPDLADVRGQYAAKRALEIAAAGEHGLLMIGPPGAGKTLLAQRLPGLLPPLSDRKSSRSRAWNPPRGADRAPAAAGRFAVRSTPRRWPRLIGGGALRPGELSLAHLGVLFLDELPEFPRNALEALREPLETGVGHRRAPQAHVRISRKISAGCRHESLPLRLCRRFRAAAVIARPSKSLRYRNRISGPLIDRIDIHIELAAVAGGASDGRCASRATERRRPSGRGARGRSARACNCSVRGSSTHASRRPKSPAFARSPRNRGRCSATAIARLGLSARAYHRVLKVARTCADLGGAPDIRRSMWQRP